MTGRGSRDPYDFDALARIDRSTLLGPLTWAAVEEWIRHPG